jgi:hypothetical protein
MVVDKGMDGEKIPYMMGIDPESDTRLFHTGFGTPVVYVSYLTEVGV